MRLAQTAVLIASRFWAMLNNVAAAIASLYQKAMSMQQHFAALGAAQMAGKASQSCG